MFFLLLALWLIFNGKITFEILWIGILVCGAIYFFCWKFMGYRPRREATYAKRLILFIRYIGLLLYEILKANISLLKIIFKREQPDPLLVEFQSGLRSDAARVILSHSITLTPGTITVELKDDVFLIHCLDRSLGLGMENSAFVKILRKMEEI